MRTYLSAVLSLLAAASLLRADETFTFKTPDGWRPERIALPPAFAPGMKLTGMEEIRFAPGMFRADAEDFFSYVFVLATPGKETFTREVIHREILAYYRGLAKQVLGGKKKTVDAKAFTLDLRGKKHWAKSPAGIEKSMHYEGRLNWVEPFATGEKQTLRMEMIAWGDAKVDRAYLFVSVSPKPAEAKIWSTMRDIRGAFKVTQKP